MHNKIETVKDLEFAKDIDMLVGLVNQQLKKNPSETLEKMGQALASIFIYVNSLQLDRWAYNESISQYESNINKLILENRELKKKNDILKDNLSFLKELAEDS